MSALWVVLIAAGVIVALVSLVDLVRHRRAYSRAAVCAWALLVVILPLLGSVFYWIRRPRPDSGAGSLLARNG